MIALFLAMICSTTPETSLIALSDDALLALAEREYAAGIEAQSDAAQAKPHFEVSAAAYEELWRRERRSPGLARNMAQAWLLAGDLARAIRAYHLGLRIAAHDSELREGIAYARASVRFPTYGNLAQEAKPRDRRTFLRFAPAWFYGAVAAGLYLLAALSAARGLMSRRPLWWVLCSVLMFGAMMTAGTALWESRHVADERALQIAVVANQGADLHRGNGNEFPLRIDQRLPEGVELVVLSERGGWLQVELGGGAIGWVDARQVVRFE